MKNIEDENKETLEKIKNQKTKKPAKIDTKSNKTKNPLIYDSWHTFYKYRLSEFSNIQSIESKFDRISNCYKDFTSLMDVDAEPENIDHKFVVINEVSKLYEHLIKEYKKDCEREPKDDKTDAWKQKYSTTSFKPLPVELKTESLSD